MPTGPNAILRLSAEGGIYVEDVRGFLTAFQQAYDCLCALENFLLLPESLPNNNDIAVLLISMSVRERVQALADPHLPWTPLIAATLVRDDDRLVLRAVELASPGFWEFLGKLNPLEVLRLYLKDRHERRKDREYREAAEREQMYWENKQRQLGVVDQALDIARKHGATDHELQLLRERFLIQPLEELGSYQDRGVISEPAFLEPVGEHHG